MNSSIVDISWILMVIHVKIIVIVNNFIFMFEKFCVILHSNIPMSNYRQK